MYRLHGGRASTMHCAKEFILGAVKVKAFRPSDHGVTMSNGTMAMEIVGRRHATEVSTWMLFLCNTLAGTWGCQ